MSVRLNKALRELKIGIQTAVDFLEKNSGLGEIKDDPNFKLNDEQYSALVDKFKPDAEVRTQGLLFWKKNKAAKEKKKAETRGEDLLKQSETQEFHPLGKIDLDHNKKQAKDEEETPAPQEETSEKNSDGKQEQIQEEAPKETKDAEEKSIETVVPQPEEVKPEPETPAPLAEEKKEEPQKKKQEEAQKEEKKEKHELTTEEKKEDKEERKTEKQPEEPAKTEVPVQEKAAEDKGTKIFQLKSDRDAAAQKMNVVGKIDLSTLNQSTRPKKKTKEERRKSNEAAAAQQQNKKSGEKKKRVRIGKERVDINDANNQAPSKKNNSGNSGNGINQNKQNNRNSQNQAVGKKKNSKKKGNVRTLEVDDDAVARQVKETLARLTNKQTQSKKGAKYRKERRNALVEQREAEIEEEKSKSKVLKLTEFVTVSELATMMGVGVNQVIGTLMSIGLMVSINQRLDAETINIVAEEFGFTTEYVSVEVQNAITEAADDENDLTTRAPIVTVMGHVDHGKTSLLDYIRKTNVIAGEAGGITQHIGAYNVQLDDGRCITFLDTPGHEAFTAMRARGAQVTDIAIIIIAADDSVMPTTKEAIAHAQAAGVPMVFAINKIDKPGANPDKIREDLAQMNLLVEEWGGKYQCQEISAKKGVGVNELLEKVLLEAEMLDLKANPNRKAMGTVIESSLDKGRGYVSTVLVSNGTLNVGDIVIAGPYYGRVKAMFNERNQRLDKVGPSEPVIVLGLNGAPQAGDSFHIMDTEQEAREISTKRMQLQREQSIRTTKTLSIEDIARRIAQGEFHELNLVVKGDVQGSVEALSDSFIKLSTEKIQVNVIQKAVGQISENDVMLASAARNGMIVGFNVQTTSLAKKLAEQEGVEINTYSVIYDAIDNIKAAMEGMLDKIKKEVSTGQLEVKEVFKISKVGTVAGAMVTDGKVHRSDKARLIRDGIVIFTGNINALKRYKDDAKEVANGLECGISLTNFNDIQAGDIIETFTEITVNQTL